MINHICHLEDLILEQGLLGGMKISNHLWAIENGSAQLSTKWDGSPSIFAGWDNDTFFVASKSYLNKTGSVRYESIQSIEAADIPEGLKHKLAECLKELRPIVPKGLVLQGDLLFTRDSVYVDENNPGHKMFHPNTLQYAIPDHLWKDWTLGVAWHSWIDRNGSVSHPQFGSLLTSKSVLSIDPTITNYRIDDKVVRDIPEMLKEFDVDWLERLSNNKELVTLTKRWYNAFIRDSATNNSYFYITTTKKKAIDKLKSSEAIARHSNNLLEMIDIMNDPNWFRLLKFQESVRASKRIIINSLNKNTKVKAYITTIDAIGQKMRQTTHEGYVINSGSESLKIVNRGLFSAYNFSPVVKKGWTETTRT